ncbi:hypothetical protein ACHAXA_003326 [Cyclostephanos tholiformis]|uniref:PD-(D/E)XK endonuclease-like domain-containing protein n=1 Tax=Cyclostephanos tholiformis TaxID=382380 RepID=A0ABD3SBD2_9STRA
MRPHIIFLGVILTMPLLSRSVRPRSGKFYQLSRPNVAASISFLTARSRCTTRATPPIFHRSRHSQLTIPRFFNASEKTARGSTTNEKDNLLDPYIILRHLTNQEAPTIPLPTHYSPTSLETFSKCPQAFFFLHILKLTPDPPMTPMLARGIICHTALEELYDLSPGERSLTNLENLFRREWNRLRGERKENALIATDNGKDDCNTLQNIEKEKKSNYDILFRENSHGDDGRVTGYDIESEIDWGKSSLDLLKNYYDLEDPKTKNPVAREMWVQARFASAKSIDTSDFIVRGKIDRIDILPTTSDKIQLQIIDYKTGKKPWLKYSRKVNDRITQEQFWKMKIYCLIFWKMIEESEQQQSENYKYGMPWVLQQNLADAMAIALSNQPKWSNILEINSLRLTYLTSHLDDASANGSTSSATIRSMGKAKYLDFSLEPPFEFQSFLEQTELEVRTICRDIETLVNKQSPHAFKHCDWTYCSCHELRKKFKPGSVFQSTDM